ncbi:MAG: calcium/sodium antiporter [Hoeflea sp.]|uniref:calcium/sodium antiporter n=1 Tax=Hoeflea sp. TaxID=1940281 RepID=UPI0032971284|tara:strand:- start:8577 stop:9515 length:939 start_codon:yes stop_codon:yes gene_type:complete
MLSILTLIAGLVVLVVAGDYLVRGAVALAEKLSIDPLIIGLTIVAFGTSAPELFVSLQAAFNGVSGIAIGNIIGSNIANVLLVLGAPALLMTINCRENGLGASLAVMIIMTLALMVMMWFGPLSRIDGAILLLMIGAYLGWQIKAARQCGLVTAPDYHDEVVDLPQQSWKTTVFIVGGLIGLPLGAWLTVDGASHIARMFGASETAIGLTIVAIGTSLPELVTSVMAAWRRSGAVAIGNVVGSNIFNIGLILGGTSVILPLDVDQRIVSIDMWVMLAAGLLVVGLAHWNIPIKKSGGLAMLAVFAIYIFSVF